MRMLLLAASLLCASSIEAVGRAAPPESTGEISVTPDQVRLVGRLDRAQLLVAAADADRPQRCSDLTGLASYRSSDPDVVSVDGRGMLLAHADGEARIEVQLGQRKAEVAVVVDQAAIGQLDFFRDVRPILYKAGCAAGACHAAQHGKGGFKLSVFGFDPPSDYHQIKRASRGRRLNFSNPAESLLLRKASMAEPHEGGLRVPAGSIEYRMLEDWIASGAPSSEEGSLQVTSLVVTPELRVGQLGLQQQLRALAHYSDGTSRDVTALAVYDSLDPAVATVDASGMAETTGRGQTAIMVRFDGQAAVSTLIVPYRDSAPLEDWQAVNFVDELAANKFRDLGLEPSPLCDDATFIRRAFLDAIGTLPDPDTVAEFMESQEPDKRVKLVDRLLGLSGDPQQDIYGDQYAAFWTLRWSDLIRNSSKSLGEQGMWALHNWIREALRENRPYDAWVRELVTAQGSIYSNGPANFFRVNSNTADQAEATAQLFLGVRLECAKCHQHPFEKYSQHDYYGMAAYFARVGTKNSEGFGLFGREQVVMVRDSGEVSHPRTRQRLQPTPLDAEPADHPLDRRIALADWLTAADNPFFARAVVNRYMRYLLGRGLVEPVDDLRSTNPPTNAELFDALADDFAAHDFDLKHLIRTIMTSRLYGLSSQPTAENVADQRFYSHFLVKRLAAEPLLDAIDHATGVKTKFPNLPIQTRAIDLPDAEYADYFLTTFAKPRRVSLCECERSPDANLAQALHTLNGETLAKKIADKQALVARLLESEIDHDQRLQRLFLASLCRPPNEAELAYSREVVDQAGSPAEGYQDLLWALINSKQFLFVH